MGLNNGDNKILKFGHRWTVKKPDKDFKFNGGQKLDDMKTNFQRSIFKKIDENGDNKLSAEEIQKYYDEKLAKYAEDDNKISRKEAREFLKQEGLKNRPAQLFDFINGLFTNEGNGENEQITAEDSNPDAITDDLTQQPPVDEVGSSELPVIDETEISEDNTEVTDETPVAEGEGVEPEPEAEKTPADKLNDALSEGKVSAKIDGQATGIGKDYQGEIRVPKGKTLEEGKFPQELRMTLPKGYDGTMVLKLVDAENGVYETNAHDRRFQVNVDDEGNVSVNSVDVEELRGKLEANQARYREIAAEKARLAALAEQQAALEQQQVSGEQQAEPGKKYMHGSVTNENIVYVREANGEEYYINKETGEKLSDSDSKKIIAADARAISNQMYNAAKGLGTDEKSLDKSVSNIYSNMVFEVVNTNLKIKDNKTYNKPGMTPVEALLLEEKTHKAARPNFQALVDNGVMTTQEQTNMVHRELCYVIEGRTKTASVNDVLSLIGDNPTVRKAVDQKMQKEPPSSHRISSDDGSYIRGALASDGFDAREVDMFDANLISQDAYGADEQEHINNVTDRLVFEHPNTNNNEARHAGLKSVNSEATMKHLNEKAAEKNKAKGYKAQFSNQEALQTYLAGENTVQGKVNTAEVSACNTLLYKGEKPARIQAEESLYEAKNGNLAGAFESMDGNVYTEITQCVENGDIDGVNNMQELYDKALENAPKSQQAILKANAVISGQVEFSDEEVTDICIDLMHDIDVHRGGAAGTTTNALTQGQANIADARTVRLKAVLQQRPEITEQLLEKMENEDFHYNYTEVSMNAVGHGPSTSNVYTKQTLDMHKELVQNVRHAADDAVFKDEQGNIITDENAIKQITEYNLSTLEGYRQEVARLEREFKMTVDSQGSLSRAANSLSSATGLGTDRSDVKTQYEQAKINLQYLELAAQGRLRDASGEVVSMKQVAEEIVDLSETNAAYDKTIQTGKTAIIMAPVIAASIGAGVGLGAGAAALGVAGHTTAAAIAGSSVTSAVVGGAAAGGTMYGLTAAEYNTSLTGKTTEAKEANAEDSIVNGALTGIGMGVGGAVSKAEVGFARELIYNGISDVSTDAVAAYVQEGDITTSRVLQNLAMSAAGNAIGAGTSVKKSPKPDVNANIKPQGEPVVVKRGTADQRNIVREGEITANIDQKHLNSNERAIIEDALAETPTQADVDAYLKDIAYQPVSEADMPAYQAHQEKVAADYAEAHQVENMVDAQTKSKLEQAKAELEGNPPAEVPVKPASAETAANIAKLENDINLLDNKIKNREKIIEQQKKFGKDTSKLEKDLNQWKSDVQAKRAELDELKNPKPAEVPVAEKPEDAAAEAEVKPETSVNQEQKVEILEINESDIIPENSELVIEPVSAETPNVSAASAKYNAVASGQNTKLAKNETFKVSENAHLRLANKVDIDMADLKPKFDAMQDGDSFLIGATVDGPNDIVINNEYVSGTHLKVEKHNGEIYITDMSTNGTVLNTTQPDYAAQWKPNQGDKFKNATADDFRRMTDENYDIIRSADYSYEESVNSNITDDALMISTDKAEVVWDPMGSGWSWRKPRGKNQSYNSVDRISLNVKADKNMLDEFDTLLSNGTYVNAEGKTVKVDVPDGCTYKTPTSLDNWGERHDPITFYFDREVSPELESAITEISAKYARPSSNGKGLMNSSEATPWIAHEKYVSAAKAKALYDEAMALNPELAEGIAGNLGVGHNFNASTGGYASAEKLVNEYKLAMSPSSVSAPKVEAHSSVHRADNHAQTQSNPGVRHASEGTPKIEVNSEPITKSINSINTSEIPPQHQPLWENCKERIQKLTHDLSMSTNTNMRELMERGREILQNLRTIADNVTGSVKLKIESLYDNIKGLLNNVKHQLQNISAGTLSAKQKQDVYQLRAKYHPELDNVAALRREYPQYNYMSDNELLDFFKLDEQHAAFVKNRKDLFGNGNSKYIEREYWNDSPYELTNNHSAWKMHLYSVDELDYQQMAEVVLPYLNKHKIAHKTLSSTISPELLAKTSPKQAGKAFTIYPQSQEDMAQIAKDLDKLIREHNLTTNTSHITGDNQLGDSGRLFYRYEFPSGKLKDNIYAPGEEVPYAANRGEGQYLANDMTPADDPWLNFDPSDPASKPGNNSVNMYGDVGNGWEQPLAGGGSWSLGDNTSSGLFSKLRSRFGSKRIDPGLKTKLKSYYMPDVIENLETHDNMVLSGRLESVINGGTMITDLGNVTNLRASMRNVGDGNVFSVGTGSKQKLYIKDGDKPVALNLSKAKFEELFPELGTASFYQPGGCTCTIQAKINGMLDSSKGRVGLFTMFEQSGDDVVINLRGGRAPVKFSGGQPANLVDNVSGGSYHIFGGDAPGIEMLQQAVLVDRIRVAAGTPDITDIRSFSAESIGKKACQMAPDETAAIPLTGGKVKDSKTKERAKKLITEDFKPGVDVMTFTDVKEAHQLSIINYDPDTGMVTFHDPKVSGVDIQEPLEKFLERGQYAYLHKGSEIEITDNSTGNVLASVTAQTQTPSRTSPDISLDLPSGADKSAMTEPKTKKKVKRSNEPDTSVPIKKYTVSSLPKEVQGPDGASMNIQCKEITADNTYVVQINGEKYYVPQGQIVEVSDDIVIRGGDYVPVVEVKVKAEATPPKPSVTIPQGFEDAGTYNYRGQDCVKIRNSNGIEYFMFDGNWIKLI